MKIRRARWPSASRIEGLAVSGAPLDVTNSSSVDTCANSKARTVGKVNVVINNAGGGYDPTDRAMLVTMEAVQAALDLNVLGAWRMSQAMLPLLRKGGGGLIVNVSSQAAAFVDAWGPTAETGGLSAYIVSKAALNALTRKLAFDVKAPGILVNAPCPGWVATYPGTAEMGARPLRNGAASIVWAATRPDDGPTGGFFRDGQPLAW